MSCARAEDERNAAQAVIAIVNAIFCGFLNIAVLLDVVEDGLPEEDHAVCYGQ
jgi:hypothetical protein